MAKKKSGHMNRSSSPSQERNGKDHAANNIIQSAGQHGKKGFALYWHIIEIPFYAYLVWTILSLIALVQGIIPQTTLQMLGYAAIAAIFGFIGYYAMRHRPAVSFAAKSGALCGLFMGLSSAVAGVVMYYFFPFVFEEAITAATSQGVPREQVEMFMKIGVYIGFVVSPALFSAAGAAISSVSALLFRSRD